MESLCEIYLDELQNIDNVKSEEELQDFFVMNTTFAKLSIGYMVTDNLINELNKMGLDVSTFSY